MNLSSAAYYAKVKKVIAEIASGRGMPFRDLIKINRVAATAVRRRVYDSPTTASMMISQMLSPDKSCQQAVNRLNAERISCGLKAVSSNTSSYCEARAKLDAGDLKERAKVASQKLEANIQANMLWNGRVVKIVDGTTFLMADTRENQSEFPQQCAQKFGCGFPICRAVAIFSMATGSICDLEIAPYNGKGTGEMSIFRKIVGNLSPGEVLLGDALYTSYFLMEFLIKAGVSFVFGHDGRRNIDFRKGEKLGKDDHLVSIKRPPRPEWMNQADYDQTAESITIREVRANVEFPGYRPKSVVVVSSLKNPKETTKEEISDLFRRRWFCELCLRNIKTTLGMEMLSSKTPAMMRKEIWAIILAYNLIVTVAALAASLNGSQVRQISFKHTIQILAAFRRSIYHSLSRYQFEEQVLLMLKLIAEIKVGKRPNRIEPRVIKRRVKKQYGLMMKPRAKLKESLLRRRQSA